MSPADKMITKLGGLTATAKALSTTERVFPVSTVKGWKSRGRVPEKYWPELVEAAARTGITLSGSDFVPATIAAVFEGSCLRNSEAA